jgi:hypothetical protein
MKKMLFLLTALCFILSACIPAAFQTQPTSPAPEIPDIQATVAAQVAQTVQSMPTLTSAPSNTPVIITATSAPTNTQPPPTLTATQNLSTPSAAPGTATVGTLPATATQVPPQNVTPTGTSHYQYYGTMPPNLPFGNVSLLNMSKRDAYISLQCTTVDGYVTVIEYPVGGSTVSAKAPAGQYLYVAWIGGKQFSGNFKLDKSQDRKILMYKDRVEIK